MGVVSEEERAQRPDLNGIGNGEHASSRLKHNPVIHSHLHMAESGKYPPLSVFLHDLPRTENVEHWYCGTNPRRGDEGQVAHFQFREH